jgi:hypothetical protein
MIRDKRGLARVMARRYSSQIALMILGTLSLTWFRGQIVDQGDFGLPLNRIEYFGATMNVWDSRWSFGALMPAQVSALPLATVGALTQFVGIPLLWYEAMTFYIWFAGSGLSMYYMCRTFGLPKSVGLFAGAFYMLNPFSLVIIWQVGQGLLQVPYMTAPLALACYNDYLNLGNLKKYVGIMLAWIGVGGTIAFVNPTYVAVVLIPVTLLFVAKLGNYGVLLQKTKAFRQLIVRSAKVTILFSLANLFWITPILSTIGEQYSSFVSSQSAFGTVYHAFSLSSANLIDSTRLFGYWALNQSAFYGPYYEWGALYSLLPLWAISAMIPLLLGAALMHHVSRLKLYFATIALGSLVLITGTNSPFGPLNTFLFDRFTFFRAFYEVFERFGILLALSFAPLVAEGLASFHRFLAHRLDSSVLQRWVRRIIPKIVIGSIALLLLVILVFPFWTGEVVQSSNGSSLSARINVPSDYYLLRGFTNALAPTDRIISLPLSTSYNIALDWPGGGYVGSDPTIWFSSVPVIMVDQNSFTELLRIAQVGTYGAQDFSRLLSIAGVNYIVYHGDANFTLLEGSAQSGESFSQRLGATLSEFQTVAHYGNLAVYSNQFSPYPLIYVPGDFFAGNLTSQSIVDLVDVMSPSSIIGTMTCNPADAACNQPQAGYIESFDYPGQAFYVPMDGLFSVHESVDSPLSNMSSAYIWEQNPQARDRFALDGNVSDGSVKYLDWTIDGTISGLRGINFQVPSNMIENLTQFYLWVKGDGSGNTLTIQIYDRFQNYIAFPQTIDWTGWKHLLVQVGDPAYSNNYTGFNPSAVSSITYYYDNSNPSNSNSTIVVGPPESRQWESTDYSSFSKGVHPSNLTIDSVILQNGDRFQLPELSFSRVGTDRYLVDVSNASQPFPLIFNQNFDTGWQLCIGDLTEIQDLYSQCLPGAEHFVANDYANGWTINKLGSYQLTILYSGDGIYHIALAVSISSWILMATSTGFLISRKRRVRLKHGSSLQSRSSTP